MGHLDDVVTLDIVAEDEGGDGRELDQDVEGWAGGVLKRVSNCVTNNGGDVAFSEQSVGVSPVSVGYVTSS